VSPWAQNMLIFVRSSGQNRNRLRNMTNTNAWGRSFIIGGVIFAVLIAFVIMNDNGQTNLTFRAGYIAGEIFIPTIITAIWASNSSKEWGWGRYIFRIVILTAVFAFIRLGHVAAAAR
jgi:hypothetical protein